MNGRSTVNQRLGAILAFVMILPPGAILAIAWISPRACAAEAPAREAGKHFQRGVELYNDGDFRGALVEFKKAYSIWPRANVLYDIGQTEYQLLDYASALKTMERFLAETGPNAVHRAEVESTVEVLRGRVGRVQVVSDAIGCDITVDDQASGTTPLEQPILVSVGPRRIAVTCAGRLAVARRFDVGSGETVRAELNPPPAPSPAFVAAPLARAAPVEHKPTRLGFALGWTVAALAAGATIACGSAALVEEARLNNLKQTFPTTRDALDHQAGLTNALAVSADVIGAATLAAIGISTYLTVKYGKERKTLHVSVSGRQVTLGATF
jgi:tetratricopeptide (TPR) repeat protein